MNEELPAVHEEVLQNLSGKFETENIFP